MENAVETRAEGWMKGFGFIGFRDGFSRFRAQGLPLKLLTLRFWIHSFSCRFEIQWLGDRVS